MQAVTITKTEGAKIRGEPTTIGMAELKLKHYATRSTPLSDELTTLFEPRHARWYGQIGIEI